MGNLFGIIIVVALVLVLIAIGRLSAKISHQTAILAILAEHIENIDKRLQAINKRLKQNDFLTEKERKDEAIMHEAMAYTHDEDGNPI